MKCWLLPDDEDECFAGHLAVEEELKALEELLELGELLLLLSRQLHALWVVSLETVHTVR